RPMGSPFLEPPRPRPAMASEATNAARPSAMREFLDPVTDELSLDELDSADLAPVQALEGEPTRARPTSDEGPSPFYFPPSEPLSEDDAPTLAFTGGIGDADDELLGEPTRALDDGTPTGAHQPASSAYDPPTYDHFPPPVYKPTPFAEPDDPPTSPKPRLPGELTPAVPPSGAQKIPTSRVRGRAKSWLMPAITGGVGLLVLGVVVAFGVSAWIETSEKDEIRSAADAAGQSGAHDAIVAVIDRIGDTDDEEMRALQARLFGTLTYEHAEDHRDQVTAIVGSLTSPEAAADARIAVALTALADGDVEHARQSLDSLPTQGEQIAEAFRAQAFMLSAMGEWEDAMNAAATAVHHRPSSPRHISLHALTGHRAGRTQWALTLLEGTPDAESHPAIRIVRARILADAQSDPAQAVQDATAVIEELADRATPPQLAWAHLIRASEGDPSHALEEARAAIEHPPPGDESFRLQLVRVLLRAGAPTEADEQLGQLPEEPVDAQGVALLTAEVALAVEDLSRAEAALGRAGSGNRQDLLRAQIYDARGQRDAARALYQRVMEVDPGRQGRTAAVRLAAIEMAAGDEQRVIALLEPRQPQAEDDLELVPLLARAYVRRERLDDAERVIDAALRRRPDAPALNGVRGSVLLARGRASDALAPLRAAAEALPRDAVVRADLGRAAQLAGQAAEATSAFEAALAIDANNSRALLGLARVAFDANDFEQATTRLEAAGEGGADALEAARLRAQLEVIHGTGAAGAEIVTRLARTHRDAVILAALGDLHAQAEQDSRARRAYESALEIDASHVQALIGEALLQIRAGSFGQAESLLSRATAAAEAQGRADALRPRVESARGWIAYEHDNYSEARSHANAAIAANPQLSSAHLLLGTVAIEENENPIEHLRHAAAGQMPSPEALGLLATRLPFGEEACTTAARYLAAAPRGFDATDVRRVQARCE
ncbi:MAG: tetratricopeptide repeat protein, partial [Sandaracinaceae bacterium]|nr:tetratricopeptide repeat protein [Sandaracinaceae bacterium]